MDSFTASWPRFSTAEDSHQILRLDNLITEP
jgi:hypothetical protein